MKLLIPAPPSLLLLPLPFVPACPGRNPEEPTACDPLPGRNTKPGLAAPIPIENPAGAGAISGNSVPYRIRRFLGDTISGDTGGSGSWDGKVLLRSISGRT